MKKKNENRTEKSVQSWLPFEEIYENGMFKNVDGAYCLMLSVSAAAYLSLPESNRLAIYEKYKGLLAALPSDVAYQEVLYNSPMNGDELKKAICGNGKAEGFSAELTALYADFAEKTAVNVAKREAVAVLSYKPAASADNPYSVLFRAASELKGRFEDMGASAKVLGADEVTAVWHRLFNPFSLSLSTLVDGKHQSIRSRIAPGDVRFAPKHVELGDAVCITYAANSYGASIDDALITDLLGCNARIAISKHVVRSSKDEALKSIDKRLKGLQTEMQSRAEKNNKSGGTYVPIDLKRAIEGCEELYGKLAGDEDLFRVTLTVTVYAPDAADLRDAAAMILARAATHFVTLKPLLLQQDAAFRTALPFGLNGIRVSNLFLTSELAAVIPFGYPVLLDDGGIYYGSNTRTGEPAVINRKQDKNSNGFVFGKSGSGKSFFAKLELASVMAQTDDDVIVVDPHGEFAPLAEEYCSDADIVRVGAGEDALLNPLAASSVSGEAERISFTIALIEAIKGSALTAIEKTIIDRAAGQLYKRCRASGITPSLKELYDELGNEKEEAAIELQLYFERYVSGSVKLFTDEAGKAATARLTVYDLSQLGEELKDIVMLAVLSEVKKKMLSNSEHGRYTWVYFDELHRYYRDANSSAAAEIERLYAECRKWGGIVTAMTQHPLGVISSDNAAAMLANSQFIALFEQDERNIDALSDRLQLSDEQKKLMLSASVGEYVLRVRNSTVSLKKEISKDSRIYKVLTTDIKDR